MIDYVSEFDIFTFEEATQKFVEKAERYGHIDPVTLVYFKGRFQLNYSKENENNKDNYCE